MRYYRVEHVLGRKWREGFEGNFREQGPIAESILATSGVTPLLVNLESVATKPRAVGGSKDCVSWKTEKVAS